MKVLVAKFAIVAMVAAGAVGATLALTDPDRRNDDSLALRAFIDAPLDGTRLAAGEIEVVVHATAPEGVAAMSLSVDGATAAERTTDGALLVRLRFPWTATDGRHRLELIARTRTGTLTPATAVTVDVGRLAGLDVTPPTEAATTTTSTAATTTTSTATTSTVATTSSGPAATTTTTSAPTPTVPAPTTSTTRPCTIGTPRTGSSTPGDARTAPTVEWSYGGCEPSEFRLELSRDPDFVRIEYPFVLAGDARAYTPPDPLDCGTWYWRVGARTGRGNYNWSGVATTSVVC